MGSEPLNRINDVFALVERKGSVRPFLVADVSSENLKRALTSQIAHDTHVITDRAPNFAATKKSEHFAKFDQVSYSMMSDAAYSLDDKGMEYAVNQGFV